MGHSYHSLLAFVLCNLLNTCNIILGYKLHIKRHAETYQQIIFGADGASEIRFVFIDVLFHDCQDIIK